METSRLFYLLLLSLLIPHAAAQHCRTLQCGLVSVRFPFHLEGKQPPNCGYPGFNLTCNDQHAAVLKLPNSKDFFIRDIVYSLQVVLLHDPDDCLPNRLQNLNLSGSPFKALFYRNYTFLSCPTKDVESKYKTMKCLDNSTHSFLATSNVSLAKGMLPSCQVFDIFQIPVSGPDDLQGNDFTSELHRDLELVWDKPDCRDCEVQGRICGYGKTNQTELQLGCYPDVQSGGTSDGLHIFRIIVMSIAAPAVICATGIACFICFVSGRHNNTQQIAAARGQPSTQEERGLDQATIESYKKIVIGESKRLPGHNDSTCAICLSEYDSKETLRCMPECEHCFHVECIDQWLHTHNSCPVCRYSPSPING